MFCKEKKVEKGDKFKEPYRIEFPEKNVTNRDAALEHLSSSPTKTQRESLACRSPCHGIIAPSLVLLYLDYSILSYRAGQMIEGIVVETIFKPCSERLPSGLPASLMNI
jgi:hypothetical protein